jgi:hypothetical protein
MLLPILLISVLSVLSDDARVKKREKIVVLALLLKINAINFTVFLHRLRLISQTFSQVTVLVMYK